MSNVVSFARDWKQELDYKAKGGLRNSAGNATLMLTHAEWQGCLGYDEFHDRFEWRADAPRGVPALAAPRAGEELQDEHLIYVEHWFSRIGGEAGTVTFSHEVLTRASYAAARKCAFHPLREYLRSLKWDGVDRLSNWCHELLGCAPSTYASEVGKWWMISAAARALKPGCQADYMLLLEGNQGDRKSTALRILGGDWYLPALPDIRTKDAQQYIATGSWIVECGEMETLQRSGVTSATIKDFLTRMVDVYRPPYAKTLVRRPRCVVFAGTTNESQSLNDPTGSRRFWPIACGEIKHGLLREQRDQLWAEAVERYEAGEQWWPTAAMTPSIRVEQEARYQEDAWTDMVLQWAEQRGAPFTVAEAMTSIGLSPDKWTKSTETRVGVILTRAGYKSQRGVDAGKKLRRYFKPETHLALPVDA